MLKDGDVFLFGEITEKSTKQLFRQLCFVEQLDIPELRLYICSYGGDVECACAIMDKLEEIGRYKRVKTIAAGKAYSAAAIILAAGQKRLAYQNSYIMFHPCKYGLPEDSHQVQVSYVNFANMTYEDILKKVCKNCGMGVRKTKTFIEKVKHDLWMTADDALKYGIIQEIV